jgi:hypothetical protein
MVYFQPKKSSLGNFWRALEWEMMVYLMSIWNKHIMAIWYILWLFGIFSGHLGILW